MRCTDFRPTSFAKEASSIIHGKFVIFARLSITGPAASDYILQFADVAGPLLDQMGPYTLVVLIVED
jgi:hypothetical protein